MDWAIATTKTQYQAAMPSSILWVILNHFTSSNDRLNLVGENHPIGPRHLPNGVRQKQQPLTGGSPNLLKNAIRHIHNSRQLLNYKTNRRI